MCARVVDDQVDVELRRHRRIDGRQELAKLSRPVALMKLADDFATLRIQGREERGSPVARVIVGAPFDVSRAHGQHGLRPIKRLDLGFFIHTQHQRFVGRVEIQPNDVAHFVDEQRVLRELERLAPMRVQPERTPR